ncbi:hypothetical protein CASFOL_009110 [Castilleja foliolosa]|uniref:Senescence domain-containing protein n=1 Tax=Castilleja foliolosa TaxID=1961234 RepID=A0ABD3E2Y8_9LAMI
MGAKSNSDVSPETLTMVQRVKQLTAMSERVATGLLSGVVKVSGFFTSSVANSKAEEVARDGGVSANGPDKVYAVNVRTSFTRSNKVEC